MKKILFLSMLAAFVGLTSCSKSDEGLQQNTDGDVLATFSVQSPASRATVTGLTRYIVEAYEGEDLSTTPERMESATGSLTLALKKNTEYTFVFWADMGTANTAITTSGDYYDATTLLDVKVNPSAYNTTATPAYCLAASFNSKDFESNKNVGLKNATAQVNFVETAGLPTATNTLKVNYSSGGKLNVATGKITELGSEISRTYTNVGNNNTLVTDYILAPLGEQRLLNLKVALNSEPEKAINNVPLQQNYKTNIKGGYSSLGSFTFTVTADDVWGTPDNELEFGKAYKVGDLYPNATRPIGVVFWVDADDDSYDATAQTSTKGKIVSLDETTNLSWGPTDEYVGTSNGDGIANRYILISKGISNYPSMEWCVNKSAGGLMWYLPSKYDFTALGSEITTVQNQLASTLQGGGQVGTQLSAADYWSSSEPSSGGNINATVCFGQNDRFAKTETANLYTRAVANFGEFAPTSEIEGLPATLTIEEWDTQFHPLTILPANAITKMVRVTTSDGNVAEGTYDGEDLVINAYNSGTATITVTTIDSGITASCVVTVVPGQP